MFTCAVCQCEESRRELVNQVFHINGAYVLVGDIPAVVCARCGEQTFGRETADRVRLMVHEEGAAKESVSMRVLQFVA